MTHVVRTGNGVVLVLVFVASITPQLQSGRGIEPTGTSPRIQRLKTDIASGLQGVVNRFWADLARQHTPIVEPVTGRPDRVLVTLVWSGSPAPKRSTTCRSFRTATSGTARSRW